MLEVSNINTFYGNIQVLWDVSFNVNEGEIFALIGANGAGKSTLLNTICGLLRPASGSIRFLGQRIDAIASHEIVGLGARRPRGVRWCCRTRDDHQVVHSLYSDPWVVIM